MLRSAEGQAGRLPTPHQPGSGIDRHIRASPLTLQPPRLWLLRLPRGADGPWRHAHKVAPLACKGRCHAHVRILARVQADAAQRKGAPQRLLVRRGLHHRVGGERAGLQQGGENANVVRSAAAPQEDPPLAAACCRRRCCEAAARLDPWWRRAGWAGRRRPCCLRRGGLAELRLRAAPRRAPAGRPQGARKVSARRRWAFERALYAYWRLPLCYLSQ